jgi:hypothetical protein
MMRILSRSFSVLPVLLIATAALAQNQVVLKTQLPPPLFVGTPVPLNVTNLEPPTKGRRPDFYVPAGTVNLAKVKKVTSSDSNPNVGTLDMIVDGDKDGNEGSWVELGPGKQWVQIDLARRADIYAILIWHFHSQARVYRGVVVQVSDDPMFKSGVTTIFNNDFSNEVGAGAGKNLNYIETYQGKLIDAKDAKGRYVRLYSNGNTSNKLNHYIEVEVWGKPAV